jgi:hypothetical protein
LAVIPKITRLLFELFGGMELIHDDSLALNRRPE